MVYSGGTRLIVIEGEPGCGKTTYVHELARRWANGDPALIQHFDAVFLIPLRNIQFADHTFIDELLRHTLTQSKAEIVKLLKDKRTLIILDGYDENTWNEVNRLFKNQMREAVVLAKIIVTTRSSHINQLTQNDLWLVVKGFTYAAAKQYVRENMEPSVAEKLIGWPNVIEVLRVPLFAAMAAASNREIQLEKLERQCIFYEIYNQFLQHHKRVNTEEKGQLKLEPNVYEEIMETLERLAFLRMATRHRQGIHGFRGIDTVIAESSRAGSNFSAIEEYVVTFGFVAVSQERTAEGFAQPEIDFLHYTYMELFAAKFLLRHMEKLDPTWEDFEKLPAFFRYMLLTLSQSWFNKYMNVAASEQHSGCAQVGLSSKDIRNLCQNSQIKLFEWELDEHIFKKFTKFNGCLILHDCTIRANSPIEWEVHEHILGDLNLINCKLDAEASIAIATLPLLQKLKISGQMPALQNRTGMFISLRCFELISKHLPDFSLNLTNLTCLTLHLTRLSKLEFLGICSLPMLKEVSFINLPLSLSPRLRREQDAELQLLKREQKRTMLSEDTVEIQ